jgi:hypothetical protein
LAPAWSRSLATAMISCLAVLSMSVGGMTVVAIGFAVPARPAAAAAPLTALVAAAVPLPARDGVLEPAASGAAVQSAAPPRPSPPPSASAPEPRVAARQPRTEPAPAAAADAAGAAEPRPEATVPAPRVHAITGPLPGTPIPAPAQPGAGAADTASSPWGAAAAGGTAIGRKSKDAGVATAGFFTRFARRVAGSF